MVLRINSLFLKGAVSIEDTRRSCEVVSRVAGLLLCEDEPLFGDVVFLGRIDNFEDSEVLNEDRGTELSGTAVRVSREAVISDFMVRDLAVQLR